MKFKKLFVAGLAFISILGITACGSNDSTTTTTDSEPEFSVNDNNSELHYLVFSVEGKQLGKIIVNKDDTVESLRPFFPTIPAPKQPGYKGVWTIPDNKVYDETNKTIIAYVEYVKI